MMAVGHTHVLAKLPPMMGKTASDAGTSPGPA
jgi:hypothetical protein